MPPLETLAAFFLAALLLAYLPGPAMLFTTAQTLAHGRRAGLLAALGIHLGGLLHVAAAAAGLSVLFHAVPPVYTGVRLAGAAYLIWMGLRQFRSPPSGEATGLPRPRGNSRSAFLHSIVVEVLNPKVALFFVAFLPQFVDAGAAFPLWVQFVVLGMLTNLMFSSADLVCVLLAHAVLARLRRSSRAQRTLQRLGGGLLVGLGLHLALQRG